MKDTDSHESFSSNEFCWESGETPGSHAYLAPTVMGHLQRLSNLKNSEPLKVLDLGCGNGAFSARMANARRPHMTLWLRYVFLDEFWN